MNQSTGLKLTVTQIWNKTIRNGRFVLELLKRLDHVDQSSEQGLNFNSAITCILPMPQSIYTGDEDGRVVCISLPIKQDIEHLANGVVQYQWDCIQRHGHSSGR